MTKKDEVEQAKESLTSFIESLGASSKTGYRLVDMLEEDLCNDEHHEE